jgi:hypothetical protein
MGLSLMSSKNRHVNQLLSLGKMREDLRPSNVEFSLSVLPLMYKR